MDTAVQVRSGHWRSWNLLLFSKQLGDDNHWDEVKVTKWRPSTLLLSASVGNQVAWSLKNTPWLSEQKIATKPFVARDRDVDKFWS